MTKQDTSIVARKAICSTFDTGYCWSCANPYYTGHYRTKKEAIEAAKRKRHD